MSGPSRAACDDISPELGGILDRRDWHRETARETRAILSWKQDDGLHSHEVELVNISGGGVAILTAKIPPRGWVLSLRLQSLDKVSVEGWLVDVRPHRKPGMHLVRIKFIMECPISLFERAIHGIGHSW
jgi:PilZ domain-containing protein